MEKKEAVREYCIGVAMELHRPYTPDALPIKAEDVIKTAKKLEEYILNHFNK